MAKERSMLARHARAVFAQYQVLVGGIVVTALLLGLEFMNIEFPPWVPYAGVALGVLVAQYLAWRAQVLKGIENYEPDVGKGLALDKEYALMRPNDGRVPHELNAGLRITTPPSELLALRVVCSAPIVEGYCAALVQPQTEIAEFNVLLQDTAIFTFRERLLPVGAELYLRVSSSKPIHLMEISLIPLKP